MSGVNIDRLADALVTAVEVRVERDMLRAENRALRARVEEWVAQKRRPPCWGPNERGDLMMDLEVEVYEHELDALLRLLDGPPPPPRTPRTSRNPKPQPTDDDLREAIGRAKKAAETRAGDGGE